MIPYAIHSDEVYQPEQIRDVIAKAVDRKSVHSTNKKLHYYNIPCSFDIETTSFYYDPDTGGNVYNEYAQTYAKTHPNIRKRSIMYVWQFGINGYVVMGRTWEQFIDMCNELSSQLELNKNLRLIVYVHNLAYEFQFMRKWFIWSKVFSVDNRKPVYAVTSNNIEFRCSLLLSGYSLYKLSNQLIKYPVKKLIGNLDYNKWKHSRSRLTQEEIDYCVNDVMVVMSYIQELIEDEHGISNIPLTNTGFVRKFCRKRCLRDKDNPRHRNMSYRDLMIKLQFNSWDEFQVMQRAYQGGFTHANGYFVNKLLPNVASYDFTSSYPYVMLSEKFPMSRGSRFEPKTTQEFVDALDMFCSVFNVRFINLKPKVDFEHVLSKSRCYNIVGEVIDNGRIISAAQLDTTITNVDYKILKEFYTWDEDIISEMWVYQKDYLPRELILCICDLYEQKTTLKGVEGKESEYMHAKSMLNSIYGMCVTNPIRDEYTYSSKDGDIWDVISPDEDLAQQLLKKHNKSRNRFLFYPWGVFVTAYARRNLYSGILACGRDYVYSDTDSLKILNHEQHSDYIEWYNEMVSIKLDEMSEHLIVGKKRFKPVTIYGEEKPIGEWDFEGVYDRFKTLGAKRYMTEKNGKLVMTVAGLGKQDGLKYLVDTYGDNDSVFEEFRNYMDVPAESTGKLSHTYLDEPFNGWLIDEDGIPAYYNELSAVHLEPTPFHLSQNYLWLEWLKTLHKTEDW